MKLKINVVILFLLLILIALVLIWLRAGEQLSATNTIIEQNQAQADRQEQADQQAQSDRQAFIDRYNAWTETVGKEWGCDKVTSISVDQDGVTYNYLCVSDDGTISVSWKVPEE